MRFALVALIALSACATIEDDPRYEMLSDACEQGDANACGHLLTLERQTHQDNARAWQNVADGFDGMTMSRSRTTCQEVGGTLSCTHW